MGLQISIPLFEAFGHINDRRHAATFEKYLKKLKYDPSGPAVEILGVKDFVLREQTIDATSPTMRSHWRFHGLTGTIDSTTYPDKARLKFKNDIGWNAYVVAMVIDGKPIRRYKDSLIHDGLRKDDDIRRNGEKLFELGNEYVIDGTQCARLADYWFKYLGKKKHIYELTVPGLAAWYSLGEWYNLTCGAAGTNEYIDSTVECYSIDCQGSPGKIGPTTLLFREVEENWTKTTLYAARAVTGGSPKRRNQQSNTLIVASSTFDGTYDYKCDGTADDVEIQAAIDYLANTSGGGTVQKTAGVYTYAATITMKDNVRVVGVGASTIDKPYDSSITTMYDWGTAVGASLENCTIDGDGSNISFQNITFSVIDGQGIGNAVNVSITGYKCAHTNMSNYTNTMFYEFKTISSCTVYGCEIGNSCGAVAAIAAFSYCMIITSCICYSNTSTTSGEIVGFYHCNAISGCSYSDNTSYGTIFAYYFCSGISASNANSNVSSNGSGYIYYNCTNLSSCTADGNIAANTIRCFNGCTYMASCSSINNQSSATHVSFYSCLQLTTCVSSGNSGTTTDIGYDSCKSVQQCKSSGDTTGYYISYADAGTTNACADTAAGGYNS
jgi:hypothetical protein